MMTSVPLSLLSGAGGDGGTRLTRVWRRRPYPSLMGFSRLRDPQLLKQPLHLDRRPAGDVPGISARR